jgi:hypothetical protein
MSDMISFTRNFNDKSTQFGFQFEFPCDSCGNGYMSGFQQNKLGTAGSVMRSAGSFLGSALGNKLGGGANDMDQMLRGKQRDEALRAAVEEAKKIFKQCTRCGKWVCPQVCWNSRVNQCVKCAPDVTKEVAAAQAVGQQQWAMREAYKEDVIKKSMGGFDLGAAGGGAAAKPKCPSCGTESTGGKFCGSCGAALVAQPTKCTNCGGELAPNARFCGGCGNKVG